MLFDPDGSELADLEAARIEAIAGARQLWAAAIVAGIDHSGQSFEITDESGQHLLTVPFHEALPASLRPVSN
ncbi:MAG: hypothetical protein EOP64_09540 [Sphingomonas sp.]|nr:MAG: hypothetical protein EOP64_09540 [Sphingomonas sp.]